MKILLRMLIGAVVGFFGMYSVLALRGSFNIDVSFTTIVISVMVVGGISMLLSFIWTWQLHIWTKGKLNHEDQDEFEAMVYNKSGDITLANSLSMILFLFCLTSSIIKDLHYILIIVGLVCIVLSYITIPISYSTTRKAYPYRDLPTMSDKDYAKKIMEAADEGERYVMFKGFSKAYMSMNILIPIGMIILMFYSNLTNTSQIAGIAVLAAIFIYTNARYLVAIRAK